MAGQVHELAKFSGTELTAGTLPGNVEWLPRMRTKVL